MFISDPTILQGMANDPIRGFIQFLKKYQNSLATSNINEEKKKK